MNPFTLASALAGIVTITCPACGHRTRASRAKLASKAARRCAKCGKPLPDPPARKSSAKKKR
jgi:DNA-directed RNA polymerase subunit RPC12/RpoP